MRCEWCYVPFRPKDSEVPNRSKLLAVMGSLISQGVSIVTIGGGDPTVYPFWGEIAREAKLGGVFVHLDTNGIGLRADESTRLVLNEFVDLLGLPLDGPNADVHFSMRGRSGHFEATLDKLRWVAASGVKTKINTIVSRCNLKSMPCMLELISKLSPTRWSIYEYWPLVDGGKSRMAHQLNEGEFAQLFTIIPAAIGSTQIEINPRLSRRLTYPIVSHDGEVYVHSRTDESRFDKLGSIFTSGTLERGFALCVGDRESAALRYR